MPWQTLLSRQTDIGQSRTSVLNPLQWTLAILLLGLFGAFEAKAPQWMSVGIGICSFGVVLLLGVAYVFFMFRNPDALRSEGFSLQKLALEKGLVGDNLHGLKTIDAATNAMVVARQGDKGEHKEQQES
jgi:hypothetical protein